MPTRARLVWCAAAALALAGARCRSPPPASGAPANDQGGSLPPPAFSEIAASLGLSFEHRSELLGDYQMPAIMGAGAAVFDADGDGDLDLYLRNGGAPASGRLFVRGADGRYADGTQHAGIDDRGYGMGCAVGDADNDGDLDLLLTNLGPNAFFRNDGDGTFSESTREAGLVSAGWSASAVFFDYDRDGWLDLYVARYVRFDPARECRQEGGRRDFCGPAQFAGETDLLYHNLGGGEFREVSAQAGVTAAQYRGLGVVAADLNGDGWSDVYVANDADPNLLWINQQDGTFVDEAMLAGAALNRQGVAEAGMGLALGDPDGDGDFDLLVTNLIEETNVFYENRGSQGFEDRTPDRGLAAPSVPYTGFGTAFFDADLDGDEDLAVANGAVKLRPAALASAGEYAGYVEPSQLYLNDGAGMFADVSAATGAFGEALAVSRGLVPFDLEGDGDLDLLLTGIGGAARLYRNDLTRGAAGNWLVVRVLDPALRREALGAVVEIVTARRRLVRPVVPAAGYLTSGDARVHVGLGGETAAAGFVVRWPDGARERFAGAPANQTVELLRGAGEPVT